MDNITKCKNDLQNEIEIIFQNNKVNDLKRFLSKREYLNVCNLIMLYLFHIIQSIGIFINSYGVSVNNYNIIWIGIGLNFIATIIQVFEKLNDTQLKKLFYEIERIKQDKYIDETQFVDIENIINNDKYNNIDVKNKTNYDIVL